MIARDPFRVDPQEMIKTLLALAAEARRPRRIVGRELAKKRKREAAARKRRAVAARLRVEARRPKRPPLRPAFGTGIAERMVAAMEPGAWYGQADLVALVGKGRSARAKVHQVLMPAGWVERRRNPLWDEACRLSPWAYLGGAVREPLHVYRLSPLGALYRHALALVG